MLEVRDPNTGTVLSDWRTASILRQHDQQLREAFGSLEAWPASLQMAVSLCLTTTTPTAIYWGAEFRLIYNDAWAPIAGEKHPWALGKRACEVWDDIWHVIEPQLRSVVETGAAFAVEDQLLPMERGGRIQQTHWDYSFAPIWGEDGCVAGIFNQGNETTARKQAERALRASEQRLEYALGASDTVGTWDWDVPNDLVSSDARFARLYGIDPELAAKGVPVAEFMRNIHYADKSRAEAEIDHAVRTGERLNIEYRLLQNTGEILWVAAQGRCILASDGTPLRFPGVSFDITARKNVEAALRDSEERFRAITNSVDQMIWSTRPNGFHDFYNQRWYDYTGVPVGSTDGEGWNGMFHPDDQARAWEVWNGCLGSGDPYHIEYRLRHRSGHYRWVLGRAQPVRDADGKITRWFGTCTDIQDIVDAREVLARSRADLEREVEERTAKLMRAEEDLRQAQKMEAIGQLSGGIAHDFNNMLAVVLGSLSLIERRRAKGDGDLDRFIHAAKDGATRAAELTQRLLAFSRKQPLEPTAIRPAELVNGMTELLSRTISENIQIVTQSAGSTWYVHADSSQLENAILNLAVNARDAMPDGGLLSIAVEDVSTPPSEADTGADLSQYVAITVSDQGTGMPQEVAAQAFDPFFTTKGVGKGTGLGLSQVFGFVQQSGGEIKLESSLGAGTSVRILLPRFLGNIDHQQTAAPTIPKEIPAGELVLIVEDDDRVRTFSREAFTELGYRTIEARDAAEALQALDENREVALLFTDLVMPGMSGAQLAEFARDRFPSLKIICTTGFEKELVEGRGSLPPGSLVLTKPFDVERLAVFVRAVQSQSKG